MFATLSNANGALHEPFSPSNVVCSVHAGKRQSVSVELRLMMPGLGQIDQPQAVQMIKAELSLYIS